MAGETHELDIKSLAYTSMVCIAGMVDGKVREELDCKIKTRDKECPTSTLWYIEASSGIQHSPLGKDNLVFVAH